MNLSASQLAQFQGSRKLFEFKVKSEHPVKNFSLFSALTYRENSMGVPNGYFHQSSLVPGYAKPQMNDNL